MSNEYAFRTSHATESYGDILATQAAIRQTLRDIDSALHQLHPQWEASESDQYQEIMATWMKGAQGLTDVLTEVGKVLSAANDGNNEVRTAIQGVLNETS